MNLDSKSKTYANLLEAFSAECSVRMKYNYFAALAKKEGLEQIAAIFQETASIEKEHAEIWYKQLYGEETSTLEALKKAVSEEHSDWSDQHRRYEKEAKQEGYHEIAALFQGVAEIERWHEQRFQALVENLSAQPQRVFSKKSEVVWICRNCGHISTGPEAPKQCEVCGHPQAYFELLAENY